MIRFIKRMSWMSEGNRALFSRLGAQAVAATAVADRVHPSLLGAKLVAWHHPVLFKGVKIDQSRSLYTTPPFSSEAVLEEVKSNPYYEKYKSKLQKRPEDDDELARKVVEARAKFREEEPDEVRVVREKLESLEEKQSLPVKLSTKSRPILADVVKLELFLEKSAGEIEAIWLEYHRNAGKNFICAVASPDALRSMTQTASENPRFIYALPRGQGMEYVLGQWNGNDVYLTPLIQYQTHGENAPVALTVHHFDELAADKGVVLMRGEFDPNAFTPVEAQFLAMQIQMFYGEKATNSRRKLLRAFNHNPRDFKHLDVVAELDRT